MLFGENKKGPSDKLGPFLFLEATIYSAQQTDLTSV
jgi:hypothetical protein